MKITNYNTTPNNQLNKLQAFKGTTPSVATYINAERMQDTFVKLAKIDSGSNESAAETRIPSTDGQLELTKVLSEELRKMQLEDIEIDENGILTATLPSNTGKETEPVIGLLAHVDTCSDVPTGPVKPLIHNYQQGDIQLNGTKIAEEDLQKHKGQTIITSDGTTLLGADDKAGITEIIETLKVFQEHPDLKHPKIRVAFTPDEETGAGISKFNIKKFGADVAYTVDGCAPEELEIENFNAINPTITIEGKNVHPGFAYGKMINSMKIASEFINNLPDTESPETTQKREGFYHVKEIQGNVEKTTMKMIVRDFDMKNEEKRIDFLKQTAKNLEEKYPGCKITVEGQIRYRNMKEKIDEFPEVTQFTKEGLEKSGLNVKEVPIRGGTDGSRLSLKNLLTPNLGAGGENFHSTNEFISLETMKKCSENILNIIGLWTENTDKVAPTIEKRRKEYFV